MVTEFILPILWAALGSLGFAVLFNQRGIKLLCSFVGGALTWLVYLVLTHKGVNEFGAYALAAGAGTLLSEAMARLKRTPVTSFIIPVNIPLVPGAALFYSLLGVFEGNTAMFLSKGKYAAGVACAMALGIFTATMVFKVVKGTLKLKRKAP